MVSSASWSAREKPDMVRYIRPGAGSKTSSSRGSRGAGSLLGIIYSYVRSELNNFSTGFTLGDPSLA